MIKKSFVLIASICFIAILLTGGMLFHTRTQSESITSDREFTCLLHDGIFYAGIDFPAGNYEITALNGSANVYSSNMGLLGGINELMDADGEKGISKIGNIELPNKTKLCVKSGIVIQIHTEKASKEPLILKEMFTRTLLKYSAQKNEFIAGEDFQATKTNRYYNVEVIKGSGRVESEMYMEWGINAHMSAQGGIDSPKTYCNITLNALEILTLIPDDPNEEFEVLLTMSRLC